jgi:hypothetical protein
MKDENQDLKWDLNKIGDMGGDSYPVYFDYLCKHITMEKLKMTRVLATQLKKGDYFKNPHTGTIDQLSHLKDGFIIDTCNYTHAAKYVYKIDLNEKVLEDSYPVYFGYLYVCDGVIVRSDIQGTILDLKRDLRKQKQLEANEILSCDIIGRRQILELQNNK